MNFDVVTFGSAVVDVFVETGLREKEKFISYPVGSKILIKGLKFDIGGGGTNTAVAFSRLGLKTGWIGKIGKDTDGERILDSMKKEKVKFLGSFGDGLTGRSIILDSKEKNRTVLTYKGENNTISSEELDLKNVKTNWFYFTSLLGKSFATQKKIVKMFPNTKVAFNPSEYLIKDKFEEVKKFLKQVDILILNLDEARMLSSDRFLLRDLQSMCKENSVVVVTDKNRTIRAYDGENKYSLRPNKVKAKERTGAGDAFASGFVAGQIVGKDVVKSLKLGLAEAESVIRYFGAKNKLLTKKLK